MATGILLPGGLLAPDPALETYRVAPGGATEVTLRGEDRVRIIDRHGGQVAELSGGLEAVGLAHDPRSSTARLFGRESSPGEDVELVADRDARLMVAAPGGRVVDGEEPASELMIEVRRASPPHRRAGRVAGAARRAAPRLPDRCSDSAELRGEGRRVHPGDRRQRQAVLGLPRVPRRASSRTGSSVVSTRP